MMCSSATYISSLVKCSNLSPFLKKMEGFFPLSFESSLCISDTSSLSTDIMCNPITVCGLSFQPLESFIGRAEALNFDKIEFINVCFYRLHILCLCLTQGHKNFSFRSFYNFWIFRPVIHLKFSYSKQYLAEFIFSPYNSQWFQHHLLKTYLFFTKLTLNFIKEKVSCLNLCGSISGLSILLHQWLVYLDINTTVS